MSALPTMTHPSVSRADVDAAFLKMDAAEQAYLDARQKWAGFHYLCIDAAKRLALARREYIAVCSAWFGHTARWS